MIEKIKVMTREEFLEKTNYREENIKGCFNCAHVYLNVLGEGYCTRFSENFRINLNGVCGYWIDI